MSRPYGFLIICLFAILFIYKKSFKLIFSILLGLLLVMPYHLAHYKTTGGFLFSNFSGCNLAQVIKPKNFNDRAYKLKGFESQIEVLEICDQAKQDIINEYYIGNPKLTFQKIFQLKRLKQIAFPAAFSPYKEVPKITTFRGVFDRTVTIILYFFYLSVILKFFLNLKNSKIDNFTKLNTILIVILPLFSSLIGHNGKESLRHTFHYYLPILFLALEIGYSNIHKEPKTYIKNADYYET